MTAAPPPADSPSADRPSTDAPAADPPDPVRIELVTAPGCHLCGPARRAVERLAREYAVGWTERDLSRDGAPHEIWWEQIPLVLVDGQVVCYWRVDEAAVRAALT